MGNKKENNMKLQKKPYPDVAIFSIWQKDSE